MGASYIPLIALPHLVAQENCLDIDLLFPTPKSLTVHAL